MLLLKGWDSLFPTELSGKWKENRLTVGEEQGGLLSFAVFVYYVFLLYNYQKEALSIPKQKILEVLKDKGISEYSFGSTQGRGDQY